MSIVPFLSVKKSKLAPVPLIAPFPVIFPMVANLLYALSDDEIGPIEVTEPVSTPSSVSSNTSGEDVTRLVFISPAPAPVPPPTPPAVSYTHLTLPTNREV